MRIEEEASSGRDSPGRPSTRIIMDHIDRKILDLLQRDATLAIAEIADRVGLSQTPCWKRIQRLEAQGVIQRRAALLDPEELGLGLTVFVSVETNDHSQAWLAQIGRAHV